MKKMHIIFLVFLASISACKKDKKDTSTVSPDINLSLNIQSSATGYNANLKDIDINTVKQVGFVWSKNTEPKFGMPNVFSYINKLVSLQFSYNVTAGLSKDSTFYVKAFYVDNNNNYHYSQQVSFKSGGAKQSALGYLQQSYTWGDEVELTLDPFTVDDPSAITIVINKTIKIHPDRITTKSIYFKVPNDLQNQYNSISVTIYGQESNQISMYLKLPQIVAGQITNLIDGNTLTITGKFFHPDIAKNKVSIGAQNLNVISATTTELVVKASNVAISESGKLTIHTGTDMLTASDADYHLYKFLKPKKDFPGVARIMATSMTMNGILYYGTGLANGAGLNDWWKYDPSTDTWTRLADYPQPAWTVSSFAIGNKIYVGMGLLSGNYSTAFYAYEPSNNTWQAIAPFQGKYTMYPVAFSSSKYSYLVGGQQSTTSAIVRVNDVWRYDPLANRWTQIENFPGTAREMAAGFTINNKGYVAGGIVESFSAIDHEAWAFDLNTEKWSQIANLPEDLGVADAFAFSIQNKGYVGGGSTNHTGAVSTYIYEYNPVVNTWTKKENILDIKITYGAQAVAIGDTGYIIGGEAYSTTGSKGFFQFNP